MKKRLLSLFLALTVMVLGVEIEEENLEYKGTHTIITGRLPIFKSKGRLVSKEAVDRFEALSEAVIMESRRYFIEEAKKVPTSFVLKSDYSKKENTAGIESYVVKTYYYIGGTHGMILETPYNFKGGREVSLGSLFKDEVNYKRLIKNRIEEIVIEADSSMFYDNITIKEEEFKFYFSGDKLVIIFNPYEIAPHESGIPAFSIPLEELSDYLNI